MSVMLGVLATMAIVTQDQAALRAGPRDSAAQQAVLWQGDALNDLNKDVFGGADSDPTAVSDAGAPDAAASAAAAAPEAAPPPAPAPAPAKK